jgi:hypothetical protein
MAAKVKGRSSNVTVHGVSVLFGHLLRGLPILSGRLMICDVFPILITQADWKTLISQAYSILKRNPAAPLDARNMPLEGPLAILKVMENFGIGHTDAHVSMGFFVHCDVEIAIAIRTESRLYMTSSEKIENTYCAVVSGNLIDWKIAFDDCCKSSKPAGLRYFFNVVYSYFDQIGIAKHLFLNRSKRPMADNTFSLE